MRRDRLEKEWRARLARAEKSQGTIRAFCKREGITEQRYYAWKQRLKPSAEQPQFVEVKLPGTSAIFELVVPSGVVIRVHQGFDVAELERLLAVLT